MAQPVLGSRIQRSCKDSHPTPPYLGPAGERIIDSRSRLTLQQEAMLLNRISETLVSVWASDLESQSVLE